MERIECFGCWYRHFRIPGPQADHYGYAVTGQWCPRGGCEGREEGGYSIGRMLECQVDSLRIPCRKVACTHIVIPNLQQV